ncbi:MAG: DUF262 domain-containing protein [bacterium]
MQLEVHFTVMNSENEIPFTIVEEGNESDLYLYSKDGDNEYKYPLKNIDGILKLREDNPFQENASIVDERLAGLSVDWLESRAQGFDNSFNVTFPGKPGYKPEDIYVENKPFSLKQIYDLIVNKDIELSPDFQRNFIWDKTRQSKLIESILLGLPLPSIYLSQYDDGRLTVVDGLQRLYTIKRFMDNELVLSNLEYLENCNGYKFSELDDVLSPLRLRRFGQTQIMCFVIDYRSPSQLKYDLFRRLNTGGKPLNNQEIRNCISRPHVQKTLKNMIDSESFGLATDFSVKDTRMEAREAALRFIYFYEQYSEKNPLGDYNGDMEFTLDNFTDDLNKRSYEQLEKYINIYFIALANAHHLFGRYCFRKVVPNAKNSRRTPVNKLMMMTLSILLSGYNPGKIVTNIEFESLVEPLAELIQSNDLFTALTYGTNGKWNIETSFKYFKEFLDNYIGDKDGQ